MLPTSLWVAFSFLTRLAPARIFTPAQMAASTRWFPVTGLVLGGLACLPSLLGAAPGHALFQGLLYVGLMAWLTRGLHWDGLADCLDAWGSGLRGEGFQTVLKDSRVGSFGALGLLFILLVQIMGAAPLLTARSPEAWGILLLAPALGRAAMLLLAAPLPPHPISTLGRLMAPGCTPLLAATWNIPLVLAFGRLCGPRALLVFLVLATAALAALYRLARREGGFNGDFLGCACLLAESAALAAPLF